MTSPLPNVSEPALRKNSKSLPKVEAEATGASMSDGSAATCKSYWRRPSPKEVAVVKDADKSRANKQQRDLRLQDHCYDQTGCRDRPLQLVLHAKLREAPTGMEDQRDDCRADTVEDTGDRLEIAEIDVESTQSRDDYKVWKDKGPATDPGTPKTAAQIGNINSNLNRERSGQRLADGNGFTHLVFGQPATLGDEFAFHLTDQRNGTAEAQQSEPEKIQKQLGQRATFYCRLHCHRRPRRRPDRTAVRGPIRMSQQPASHDFAFAILSNARTQSPSELYGVIVRPEVHEKQARLLIKHVTVQGRDLDPVGSKGFDHRVDLISGQHKIARDRSLAAASWLKTDAGRHPKRAGRRQWRSYFDDRVAPRHTELIDAAVGLALYTDDLIKLCRIKLDRRRSACRRRTPAASCFAPKRCEWQSPS